MPASRARAGEGMPRPQIPTSAHLLVACVLVERAVLGGRLPPPPPSHVTALVVASCAMVVLAASSATVGDGLRLPVAGVILTLALSTSLAWALSGLLARGMGLCEAELGRVAGSSCTLLVESDSVCRRGSHSCRASVKLPSGRSCRVWLRSPQRVWMGELLRCSTRWSPLDQDGFGASSRMQGVVGSLRIVSISSRSWQPGPLGRLRAWRSDRLEGLFAQSTDSAAWIAGVALGSPALARERGMGERLSRCGLSHLLAVSGSHLAIATSIACTLLLRLDMPLAPRLAASLSLGMALVLLCGAPPSAVRALLMSASASGSELLGRRGHALSSLCLVGLVMALLDPSLSGSLGFLLSLVSVAGLCLLSWPTSQALRRVLGRLAPPWGMGRRRLPRPLSKLSSVTLDLASASLVAQVSTLPLCSSAFGTLSLVAPLSNLLAVVPFTLGLATGLPGLLLEGLLPWARLPLDVSRCCFELLSALVGALSALPLAAVGLPDWGGVEPLLWSGLVALALVRSCVRMEEDDHRGRHVS